MVLVILEINIPIDFFYIFEPWNFRNECLIKILHICIRMVCPGVYLLNNISAVELDFEEFSHSSKVLFSYFFFHLC